MARSEGVVHLAFLPSAGMGHLNPFLRFAALFLRHGCKVTLITPKPLVSLAELNLISRFCSSFPQQVTQIDLNLIPLDSTTVDTNDPFFHQFETIRRSVHLVGPILSSLSPPLSAFIYDMTLISPILPILNKLSCPSYLFFTSSARMLSFAAYLSVPAASNPGAHPSSFIGDVIEIPGIESPVPRSSVPPLLLQPGKNVFQRIIVEDSENLTKLNGVFVNTFEEIEGETVGAINEGKVVKGLPQVYGVGPLMACEFEKVVDQGTRGSMSLIMKWLDEQGKGSVVYVCLGNRTETRRQQIKDLALGLIESGYRFLWVVKLKMVDREEEEDLEDVLGSELMNRVKENGVVVKEFVDQVAILGHPAVGGFVSHAGWNSVTETVRQGVPILSWPQHSDQKMNAEVMRITGMGILPEDWGWGREQVVKGKDIAKRIKEMMSNESLRVKAAEIKEAAKKAAGVGGSCEVIIKRQIEEWKRNAQAT